MAISHAVSLRNTFATNVISDLDGGGGAAQCVLKTGATTVATIPLNIPSFAAPVAGLITLDNDPIPEDPSAVGGTTVTTMEFQDSTGALVFAGDNITAIGGGGDLELSKNPIAAGDIVQLTSFTYQAAP